MNSTNIVYVSAAEAFKADRLDPGYFIALKSIRDAKVDGQSLLEHYEATLSSAQARELVERLPATEVIKLLAPLARPGLERKAADIQVAKVLSVHPYGALVLVSEGLEALQAQSDAAMVKAVALQNDTQAVQLTRPARRLGR